MAVEGWTLPDRQSRRCISERFNLNPVSASSVSPIDLEEDSPPLSPDRVEEQDVRPIELPDKNWGTDQVLDTTLMGVNYALGDSFQESKETQRRNEEIRRGLLDGVITRIENFLSENSEIHGIIGAELLQKLTTALEELETSVSQDSFDGLVQVLREIYVRIENEDIKKTIQGYIRIMNTLKERMVGGGGCPSQISQQREYTVITGPRTQDPSEKNVEEKSRTTRTSVRIRYTPEEMGEIHCLCRQLLTVLEYSLFSQHFSGDTNLETIQGIAKNILDATPDTVGGSVGILRGNLNKFYGEFETKEAALDGPTYITIKVQLRAISARLNGQVEHATTRLSNQNTGSLPDWIQAMVKEAEEMLTDGIAFDTSFTIKTLSGALKKHPNSKELQDILEKLMAVQSRA